MLTMRQKPWQTAECLHNPLETNSYDISCSWAVNRKLRFSQAFDGYYEGRVADTRDIIDECHLNGHGKGKTKRNVCYDLYNGHHMPLMGHNPFETVEQVWVEMNQCGASTRQMSAGNRHDTLNAHAGNWNWCKEVRIGMML